MQSLCLFYCNLSTYRDLIVIYVLWIMKFFMSVGGNYKNDWMVVLFNSCGVLRSWLSGYFNLHTEDYVIQRSTYIYLFNDPVFNWPISSQHLFYLLNPHTPSLALINTFLMNRIIQTSYAYMSISPYFNLLVFSRYMNSK